MTSTCHDAFLPPYLPRSDRQEAKANTSLSCFWNTFFFKFTALGKVTYRKCVPKRRAFVVIDTLMWFLNFYSWLFIYFYVSVCLFAYLFMESLDLGLEKP